MRSEKVGPFGCYTMDHLRGPRAAPDRPRPLPGGSNPLNSLQPMKTASIHKLPPTQRLGWLDSRFPMFRLHRLEFLESQAKLGDISHFRMGPYTVYFINHPDLIRDVLVVNADKFMKGRALQRSRSLLGNGLLTSEREFHLRQRRMIQPAFHRTRIAEYAMTMTDIAHQISTEWRDLDKL